MTMTILIVFYYSFLFSDGTSAKSSPPESPIRTLAARKAYDEPLNISIQRKVNEDSEDIKKDHRYHPYQRPTEPEQESPMNLEVSRKPWYRRREPDLAEFMFRKPPPIRG